MQVTKKLQKIFFDEFNNTFLCGKAKSLTSPTFKA